MSLLNETHDPALRSWLASANTGATDFPLQNLPFAVFRRQGSQEAWRVGVALGDQIVDIPALHALNVLPAEAQAAAAQALGETLNALMAAGPAAWSALRLGLSRVLRAGAEAEGQIRPTLVAQADAEYTVPARITDYTDFYASIHHATAVGALFRPDNPLLPNYKWVPIGYHGRVSSIDVSGQQFRRPSGQILPKGATEPVFSAAQRLDYELEMGIFVGTGNTLGDALTLDEADRAVFGLCLLNDWSARDIQAWEYQPLGPFLAKNFATTISPWIVTREALAPYRTAWDRVATDPQPLAYLDSPDNRAQGAFDIQLQALLTTEQSRAAGNEPAQLSQSSFRHSYWNVAQMVAHHTVNGCNLQAGDLLGTGTQSGPAPDEAGSLLELTHGGQKAITLPWGEERRFLQDGDEVIFRAWCEGSGQARIGFGEVRGTILPARQA